MNKARSPWTAAALLLVLAAAGLYYTHQFYTEYRAALDQKAVAQEDYNMSSNIRNMVAASLATTRTETEPHRTFLEAWQAKQADNSTSTFDLFVSRTAEAVNVISRDNASSTASTVIDSTEIPVELRTIRLEGEFPRLITAIQEIESSMELWGLRALRFSPAGGSTSMEATFALPALDVFFTPTTKQLAATSAAQQGVVTPMIPTTP